MCRAILFYKTDYYELYWVIVNAIGECLEIMFHVDNQVALQKVDNF